MNCIYGIILAGGVGNRMGADTPKQFMQLRGKSLVAHSVEKFNSFPFFKSIVVVSHPDYIETTEKEIGSYLREGDRIVEGGATRHQSTLKGLSILNLDKTDTIVIHDAARPFFTIGEIFTACKSAAKSGASTLASSISETAVVTKSNLSVAILDRESVFLIKTPQVLQAEYYEALLDIKFQSKDEPTDLCSWVSFIGKKTEMVESSPFNIKITKREDLNLAESIYDLFSDWEKQNPFVLENCGCCS